MNENKTSAQAMPDAEMLERMERIGPHYLQVSDHLILLELIRRYRRLLKEKQHAG